MLNFSVYYYENYNDVHSWKAEPQSVTIKAKDKNDAKSIFRKQYPKFIVLGVANPLKEIKYGD